MSITMGSNPIYEYGQLLDQLGSYSNIPQDLISSLRNYISSIYRSEQQNSFSEPMPWIGMYIALASLFCNLAMVADLLHGLRDRKLWFQCKYFTLNAASLSVIAVAMKLPMDLNNPMPGIVDQAAKLGSMAFMCTIMANFFPSLATMGNKELLTNIIALGVLVITLVVNVCIQIKTGVVTYSEDRLLIKRAGVPPPGLSNNFANGLYNKWIAIIYSAMLLFLLILLICTAVALPTAKWILEPIYQAGHKTALKDQERQRPEISTVEKLKQHVSKYLIMTGTGSPQFLTACSATCPASGVICFFSTVIHVIIIIFTRGFIRDYKSDYKWSILVILITQFIGVILGTIAPLFRCFTALSFKLSIKWIWSHIRVFKVENYWTLMLYDLKHIGIPFPLSSRRCKIVVQNLKNLILSVCIGFLKTIVVTCKTLGLVPIFFVICVVFCFRCWRWLKASFFVSSRTSTTMVRTPDQPETNVDLSHYVLQLQEDVELAERTLKGISNSVDHLIQKAEKQQPTNLMKLLEGSRGFEGVEKFDSPHVPPLLSEEPLLCWSLTVVTLTSVAISLPNIENGLVDSLLSGVSEGLVYVTLVEESFNTKHDHVCVQKVAKRVWLEVSVYCKWLGNRLQKLAPEVNTAGEILRWFRDTAKNMVMEVKDTDIRGLKEDYIGMSISANSMYRITETILLSYVEKTEHVNEVVLFAELSSMIADILAACLTNVPRVISMKCYSDVVEKRGPNAHAAALLLGETTQIINSLQNRRLPSLKPDEMAFIDKWWAYLNDLAL